jgi:biotin operon repressor
MKTSEKIIKYIERHEQASGKELADFLNITDRAVRKQLKALLEKSVINKIGRPPRVFYFLSKVSNTTSKKYAFPRDIIRYTIDKNFTNISLSGERTDGVAGFIIWCEKRGFDVVKKAKEYMEVYKKYNDVNEDNLISGKSKIIKAFGDDTCLDDVFYGGFYAWEVFGKTKLGQLLLYAKQSQDRKLIKEVVKEIEPIVRSIIKIKNIDAVGFIPPTVKRQTQFMKVFQESLSIALPSIDIVKIKTEIITPQKTLSKLPDRIENANNTMVVTEKMSYKNVLLIDDAVGSGATLNQVACKVKKNNVAKKVYGFAITGSIKGFDVISEV